MPPASAICTKPDRANPSPLPHHRAPAAHRNPSRQPFRHPHAPTLRDRPCHSTPHTRDSRICRPPHSVPRPRIRGQAVLADRWTPDQSLADNDGSVRPEIVWASLDCPGGWAAFDRIPGGVAVLGRMTAQVDRAPFVGERCVVVASSRWRDGRKIDAHSALYSCDGELLAAARAVWIDVTPGGAG